MQKNYQNPKLIIIDHIHTCPTSNYLSAHSLLLITSNKQNKQVKVSNKTKKPLHTQYSCVYTCNNSSMLMMPDIPCINLLLRQTLIQGVACLGFEKNIIIVAEKWEGIAIECWPSLY